MLSDISFTVEGKTIKAHKIILGLRSNYFKTLVQDKGLSSNSLHSYPLGISNLVIEAPYEIFYELVHFCYKPTIKFEDKDKLLHLKDLNSKYKVLELSEMIEEELVPRGKSEEESLGMKLQTSAAIQTEMAPGILPFLFQ